MHFDADNTIVKLCARGMEMEGQGKPREALQFFTQAWNEAITDFEKFTAAHYVARHQASVADKLKWDETALHFAMKVTDDSIKSTFPSLYLNIGKCHEDLKAWNRANENYALALSFAHHLPNNGYGNMIKNGISNGIERVTKASSTNH